MSNTTSRIRHLFSFAAIALVATLGAGLVHAGELPFKPIGGALDPRMNARFDVLTAEAQAQGTVRVIVRLKEGQPPKQTLTTKGAQTYQAAIASTQSRVMTTLAKPVSAHAFKTVPYMAMEVDAMDLSALRQSPEVEAVFEDRMLFPALADSVPLIGADKAAAAGYSGADETIAILDTGVDKTHPDLAGKVVAEACFSSPSPTDEVSSVCPNGQPEMIGEGAAIPCEASGCEHGTHVAGIAAGRQGVARDANIIAIQMFSQINSKDICAQVGSPAPCTSAWNSDIMAALDYVYSLHSQFNIAAVNMSLGGDRFTSACDDDPAKPFIDNLYAAGIATVVASGNEYYIDAMSAPACVSSAVSVGATTKYDTVADFSNSSRHLDLLAPGVDIVSSVPGGYASFSGTSMAAPHVTGAFAVLKGAAPTADVDTLLTALYLTGVPITDPATASSGRGSRSIRRSMFSSNDLSCIASSNRRGSRRQDRLKGLSCLSQPQIKINDRLADYHAAIKAKDNSRPKETTMFITLSRMLLGMFWLTIISQAPTAATATSMQSSDTTKAPHSLFEGADPGYGARDRHLGHGVCARKVPCLIKPPWTHSAAPLRISKPG